MSGPGQPLPSGTPIQPRRYHFAPINEPSNPSAFQPVSLAPGESAEKAGKKRGRPSKAERELREAEAAARGEVYQPTKRKKQTTRPSAEGADIEGAGAGPATPEPRRKVKKQKATPVAPTAPPMSVATLGKLGTQAATGFGGQMQIESPERPVKSTIPETQASEFQITESLLAEMREQAAQSEGLRMMAPSQMGTAQSSVTLQQAPTPGTQTEPAYPPATRR